MDVQLYNADCLGVMPWLPEGCADMILCDLPYGTTACKWDTIIPFEPLWEQYKRLIKPNGAIVLFGSEPFSSKLRMSNLDWYKYDWYWVKSKVNGWQHAKNRPMTKVETVSVFSPAPMGHASLLGEKRMNYYPQGAVPAGKKVITENKHGRILGARPNQVGREYESYTGFPSNVLEFENITGKSAIHPTQKPVALLEYLTRTYTNEGETVLDNTMGSGSTGVACMNTGRNFIGIELAPGYFETAKSRIEAAKREKEEKENAEGHSN